MVSVYLIRCLSVPVASDRANGGGIWDVTMACDVCFLVTSIMAKTCAHPLYIVLQVLVTLNLMVSLGLYILSPPRNEEIVRQGKPAPALPG
jgi:hypothetical protein